MCKVSVIVPVYNVEKYVKKCVQSLIEQVLEDIEIIIINDGSTDKSFEIVKNIAVTDSRIKVINQKNSGLSAARNSGLKSARGEYVVFVDSDDWVENRFLFKLYNVANEEKCDVVACNFIMRSENDRQEYKYKLTPNKIYYRNDIIGEIGTKLIGGTIKTTVWDKMYNREFLTKNNISFMENIVRFEDWFFFMDVCTYMESYRYIDEGLYNYRVVGNSLSHKYYENFFDMIKNMNVRKLEFMKLLSINNENNIIELRNNFIDDLVKTIKHIIYDSNRNFIYKLRKINDVLHDAITIEILEGKVSEQYLSRRSIDKKYGKLQLSLIKRKNALCLMLLYGMYKRIKLKVS